MNHSSKNRSTWKPTEKPTEKHLTNYHVSAYQSSEWLRKASRSLCNSLQACQRCGVDCRTNGQQSRLYQQDSPPCDSYSTSKNRIIVLIEPVRLKSMRGAPPCREEQDIDLTPRRCKRPAATLYAVIAHMESATDSTVTCDLCTT